MRARVQERRNYKEYNSDSEPDEPEPLDGNSESETSDSETSDSGTSDGTETDSEMIMKKNGTRIQENVNTLIKRILSAEDLDEHLKTNKYASNVLLYALTSTYDIVRMQNIVKYIADINVTINGILIAEGLLLRSTRFHSLLEFFLNHGLDLSRIRERAEPYMYLTPYNYARTTFGNFNPKAVYVEFGNIVVLLGGFDDVLSDRSKFMSYVQRYNAASLPSYLNFVPEKYWMKMGPTDNPLENKSLFNAEVVGNPRPLWGMDSVHDYYVLNQQNSPNAPNAPNYVTSLSVFVSPVQFVCTGVASQSAKHPVLLESIRIFLSKGSSLTETHGTISPIDIIGDLRKLISRPGLHLADCEKNRLEDMWSCVKAFYGDFDESKVIRLTKKQKNLLFFMHLMCARREDAKGFRVLHTDLIIKIAHMALNV